MDNSKDLARALRRHHAVRLKKARSTYWGRQYGSAYLEPLDARQRGILLATPAICSCWGCGNPRRRIGEDSLEELRWAQHSLCELLADSLEDATDDAPGGADTEQGKEPKAPR